MSEAPMLLAIAKFLKGAPPAEDVAAFGRLGAAHCLLPCAADVVCGQAAMSSGDDFWCVFRHLDLGFLRLLLLNFLEGPGFVLAAVPRCVLSSRLLCSPTASSGPIAWKLGIRRVPDACVLLAHSPVVLMLLALRSEVETLLLCVALVLAFSASAVLANDAQQHYKTRTVRHCCRGKPQGNVAPKNSRFQAYTDVG